MVNLCYCSLGVALLVRCNGHYFSVKKKEHLLILTTVFFAFLVLYKTYIFFFSKISKKMLTVKYKKKNVDFEISFQLNLLLKFLTNFLSD